VNPYCDVNAADLKAANEQTVAGLANFLTVWSRAPACLDELCCRKICFAFGMHVAGRKRH